MPVTGLTFIGKFNSAISGLFKTNTTKAIGSDDLRTLVTDVDDSYYNKVDSNQLMVNCGDWDFSANSDLFPETGGTAEDGSVRKNNFFDITGAGTPSGATEPIPVGAMIRAKVDNPGQTLANWRIFY